MSTSFDTLISAEQLLALMTGGAAPVIIDTRFDLADTAAGERDFAAGHLPAAVYLHLDRDLSGAKAGPGGAFKGRHPLPERSDFVITRSNQLPVPAPKKSPARNTLAGRPSRSQWRRNSISIATRISPLRVVGRCGVSARSRAGMCSPKL